MLMSGICLSTKMREDIKFDVNKLSESLKQLIALDEYQNTVDQIKAFIAQLDAGMVTVEKHFTYLSYGLLY